MGNAWQSQKKSITLFSLVYRQNISEFFIILRLHKVHINLFLRQIIAEKNMATKYHAGK